MSTIGGLKRIPSERPGHLPGDWATREHEIPVVRYIDRDFAKLEAELFWPRVWQMACRLDQIPNPGDYTVYDILQNSIVVVRLDEDTVKAYHNVCPHRATMLARGSGKFQLEQIICPFHGWKWNLHGENKFIPSQEEFRGGCLKNEDANLNEVHVRVWAGFVYINMAINPPPFEDMIEPIASLVGGVMLGEMKHHYHYQARVNCNWKVAQEAFMESYHVPQTHPQLTPGKPEDFTSIYRYETFPHGHGLFHSGGANAVGRVSMEKLKSLSQEEQTDLLLRGLQTLQVGQDAQAHIEEVDLAHTMRHRKIPDGMTVGQYFQVVIREHYAAQGRAIGTVEDMMKVGDMHIFPNVIYLPTYGNAVMYRVRPSENNDPDWCIFDMYAIRTYPEGVKPPRWETKIAEGPLEDARSWWLIPSQDFASIVRQQRGMHSMAIESTVLSSRQESIITNMHRELDNYLNG